MDTSALNDYLPKYRFPRLLRISCGCLALLLLASALFIFFLVPGIFAYIVTLDEYPPPLEIQLGETLSLEAFDLTLSDIKNGSGSGSLDLIFSSNVDNLDHVVTYTEGQAAPDPISLPLGYLLRVMAVSPVDEGFVIQFHVFKLPASYTHPQ